MEQGLWCSQARSGQGLMDARRLRRYFRMLQQPGACLPGLRHISPPKALQKAGLTVVDD